MAKLSTLPTQSDDSLAVLRDYVVSYAGLNGGDPKSPVWLCGLEYGNSLLESVPPPLSEKDFVWNNDTDHDYFTPKMAEDWVMARWDGVHGRPGGCSFYRSQFGILTALIENTASADELTASRYAAGKYEYLGENRLGYSCNLSPIGMSNRKNAEAEWNQSGVIQVKEYDHPVSMAEWTGFKHYANVDPNHPEDSFMPWCVRVRSPLFVALRRKYAPKVIYCGGFTVAFEEFCELWSGQKSAELALKTEDVSGLKCSYAWLDNGPDKQPTLLMIGPFFTNQYGLNSYDKCWSLAKAIRTLIEEKLGQDALRLQKFLPTQSS